MKKLIIILLTSFLFWSCNDNQSFVVDGVTFNMIYVKGGTFQMGATSEQLSDAEDDEKPVHSVTVSDFYIGETEVTQGLWKAVMGENPSCFQKGDDYPVEFVSWDMCQDFIEKLNQKTGKTFCLPTEAEWEFAARGGNKSLGFKYSGSNDLSEVAWYGFYDDNDNNRTITEFTSMPVKQKKANELGLYDMSGNVYEWCQDWYDSYSDSPQTDPQGADAGCFCVLRGGTWCYDKQTCRVSKRSLEFPNYKQEDYGLRLVLIP